MTTRRSPQRIHPATVAAADPKQLPEIRTRIRSPQHSPRARAGTQEGPQPSRATRSPAEDPSAALPRSSCRSCRRSTRLTTQGSPQRIHPATVAAADPKQLPEIRTRIRSRSTHPGPTLVPRKARSLPGQPGAPPEPGPRSEPRSGPQGRSCRRRSFGSTHRSSCRRSGRGSGAAALPQGPQLPEIPQVDNPEIPRSGSTPAPATVAAADPKQLPENRTRIRSRSTHPGPALVPRKARSLPGQPEPRRRSGPRSEPPQRPPGPQLPPEILRQHSPEAAAGDPDADPDPAALTQGPRWYPGRPAAFQGNRSPAGDPARAQSPAAAPRAAAAAGSLKSKPRNTYKFNPHFVHR